MWNEKEMLESMDKYFNEQTKEGFLKDLEEKNCLEFVEDVKEESVKNIKEGQ